MRLTEEQKRTLCRAASLVMEASFILKASGVDELARTRGFGCVRGVYGLVDGLNLVRDALEDMYSKLGDPV